MEPRRSRLGALRIALFIACFNDTLFPETGKAVVRLLERLGHEVVFPEEQTCCGQMHANSGYGRRPCRWRAASSRLRRATTRSSPLPARAPRWCATATRAWPSWRRTTRSRRVAAVGPARARAHRAAGRRPRRRGRRRVLPAPRDLPPDLPLAAPAEGRRPPAAAAAPVRGIDLVELPEAETCCGFGGTFAVKNADTSAAMLDGQDAGCARHAARSLHRAGQLVPAAHRRRALARGAPGARRCTWPRSWPARRGVTGEALPGAAARLSPTRSCGATWPRARRRSVRARGGRGRGADWEALRDAGRGSRRRAMRAPADDLPEQLEARSRRPAATCTGRATRAEANRSLPARPARQAHRGGEGQVAGHRRDRAQRGARGRGHHRAGDRLAELIVQLGDDRRSHILVPAIHRSRGEIRDLFRATIGRGDLRRSRGARRGGAAPPARAVPAREVGVSGANFAVAETGTLCVVEFGRQPGAGVPRRSPTCS